MNRPTLAELEVRCQKPDHRRSGNWMARRVSRAAALRITWIVHPWGVSAHAMTIAALVCAIAAAVAFAHGNVPGWLVGSALLQLWYLLDHVDGQLARLHGAATLDGMQLDYLMHHLVNLVIPWGVGFGLMQATGAALWLVAGLIWSLGLLLLGLVNDARYKAFIGRLKHLEGPLIVLGGEKPKSSYAPTGNPGPCARPLAPAGSPGPCARPLDDGQAGQKGRDYLAVPRKYSLSPHCAPAHTNPKRKRGPSLNVPRWRSGRGGAMQVRWIVHAARKFCEIHVVMNSLTAIAVAQSVTGNLALGKFYLVVAAPLALATAVATLTRDIHRGAAEQEFARWYRAPKDAVEEASSVAEAKADRIGASQSAENSVGQAMPRCLPPRIRRDDANLGR